MPVLKRCLNVKVISLNQDQKEPEIAYKVNNGHQMNDYPYNFR